MENKTVGDILTANECLRLDGIDKTDYQFTDITEALSKINYHIEEREKDIIFLRYCRDKILSQKGGRDETNS